MLESFWGRFGVVLGSFWGQFGVGLGSALGGHFRVIKGVRIRHKTYKNLYFPIFSYIFLYFPIVVVVGSREAVGGLAGGLAVLPLAAAAAAGAAAAAVLFSFGGPA